MRSVGGDIIKGAETKITFGKVGPGEEVQAKVMFTAPEAEGRYINYWRLFNGDRRFGDRMWLDVTVTNPSAKEDEEKLHGESSTENESSEKSSESGNTALDNLTDWVAVADALRASGSTPEGDSHSSSPLDDGKEPPEEHEYKQQLDMMRSMGFEGDATIMNALENARGNIGDAVNLMLASRS